MKLQDILWLSYKDLSEKKVRTVLTIIMVMVGVAAIVSLTALTAGISASVQSSLQALGPTSIILTSTRSTGFTLADTTGISSLPNVSSVIPIVEGSGTLKTASENTSVSVIGISSQGLQGLLSGINIYQGSVYNNTVAPTSVIGYSLAFPSSNGGRQSVTIGTPVTLEVGGGRSTKSYTVPVVGILQSYSSFIISVNTAVIMSEAAAEELLGRSSFNVILVKATNASSVTPLTTTLTNIYGNNARILSTQQIAATVNQVIGGISLLLIFIAGISLLVASIGIMNIMLMAVLERTHEIGIMKSIGFTSRQVLVMFLVQAMIIGFAGGIVGLVVGAGGAYTLASLSSSSSPNSTSTGGGSGSFSSAPSGGGKAGSGQAVAVRGGGGGDNAQFGGPSSSSGSSSGLSFEPVFTLGTIAEALIVAVSVAALAGIYPAWRASKMQPIDALRQL
ncbi:MAG: ABC transporter permease [Candidatus Micrarchaeota archaeon]|nr:ABC transporter permease [Candidatus Micrarchaeota archaeon]